MGRRGKTQQRDKLKPAEFAWPASMRYHDGRVFVPLGGGRWAVCPSDDARAVAYRQRQERAAASRWLWSLDCDARICEWLRDEWRKKGLNV